MDNGYKPQSLDRQRYDVLRPSFVFDALFVMSVSDGVDDGVEEVVTAIKLIYDKHPLCMTSILLMSAIFTTVKNYVHPVPAPPKFSD